MKKTLCLDFDGVLHSYTSGWKGADNIPDPPVEGAQKFVQDALEFFDIVVVSSRCSESNGIEAMLEWLEENDFPDLLVSKDRPAAFVTLDDRALTFDGEWPSVEELIGFTPWWKK